MKNNEPDLTPKEQASGGDKLKTEIKIEERCTHLFGIRDVKMCTKLGTECPSAQKCVAEHGDEHYQAMVWSDNDRWNFWGF
jgi:hypothetical protein